MLPLIQFISLSVSRHTESRNLALTCCLFCRPRHVMATVEAIVREASDVPVYLPNVSALKESLRKAREWSDKVDQVQVRTVRPIKVWSFNGTVTQLFICKKLIIARSYFTQFCVNQEVCTITAQKKQPKVNEKAALRDHVYIFLCKFYILFKKQSTREHFVQKYKFQY